MVYAMVCVGVVAASLHGLKWTVVGALIAVVGLLASSPHAFGDTFVIAVVPFVASLLLLGVRDGRLRPPQVVATSLAALAQFSLAVVEQWTLVMMAAAVALLLLRRFEHVSLRFAYAAAVSVPAATAAVVVVLSVSGRMS